MSTADTTAADELEVDDHFVTAEAAEGAYALLRQCCIPSSTLYVPVDCLQAPATAEALSDFLPPALAAFLADHLRRLLGAAPHDIRAATDGFEVWSTRATRSTEGRIYLHVDCDEEARTGQAVLRTPLLGSILYLGPATGLVGGETAFVDDQASRDFPPFAFHDWAALHSRRDAVRVVQPRAGRLVLFAGSAIHGQAPVRGHPEDQPRIALLANFWAGRIGRVPQGFSCLSPAAFRARAGA